MKSRFGLILVLHLRRVGERGCALKGSDVYESDRTRFKAWVLSKGCNKYASGCREETATRTLRNVRRLSRIFDIGKLDIEKVYVYVQDELEKKGKLHKTLRLEMEDLKRWTHFSQQSEAESQIPHFRKEPSPEPRIPTDEELKTILAEVRAFSYVSTEDMSERRKARLRTAILIMAYGGPRIGEVCRIKLEDLRDDGLFIRSEKGETNRTVTLPEHIVDQIRDYVRHYRHQSGTQGLLTTPNGKVTKAFLRKELDEIFRKVGMSWVHPHTLRHYCGTLLARLGVPVITIAKQLGHSQLQTSMIYIHLAEQYHSSTIKDAFSKFFREEEVKFCNLN